MKHQINGSFSGCFFIEASLGHLSLHDKLFITGLAKVLKLTLNTLIMLKLDFLPFLLKSQALVSHLLGQSKYKQGKKSQSTSSGNFLKRGFHELYCLT